MGGLFAVKPRGLMYFASKPKALKEVAWTGKGLPSQRLEIVYGLDFNKQT